MPSQEENYLLLWTLISQKCDANGVLPGIDWVKVAEVLKLNKIKTAQCRWSALKDEFRKMGFEVPGKSGRGKPATKTTTPKTTSANPRSRSAVTKPRGKGKGTKGKNVEVEIMEDDEEEYGEEKVKIEDEMVKEEVDEYAENGGRGYQELSEDEVVDV